jgi:hypothetical protein
VTQNLAGAGVGVGVTFHPQVWPQAGLGGCHGCGHGLVFVKSAPLPSLVHRLATMLNHINVMFVPSLFTTPRKDSRLFGLAFSI